MEAQCLMKNLSYLKINISRTKNDRNKLQKVLEQGVVDDTDCFHLIQITNKNSQFIFKTWWFSTFTTFLLHSWNRINADFCISWGFLRFPYCGDGGGVGWGWESPSLQSKICLFPSTWKNPPSRFPPPNFYSFPTKSQSPPRKLQVIIQ